MRVLLVLSLVLACACNEQPQDPLSFVKPFTGTDDRGATNMSACLPFGMVQLGPDTRFDWNSYHYRDTHIYGFSHLHKSGGGCSDFQDILFLPVVDYAMGELPYPEEPLKSPFKHDNEFFEPGYYMVKLLDTNIDVELTATERSGLHRYSYPEGESAQLIIDLKTGHNTNCTIYPEDNFDTVKVAHMEVVDEYTVQGYRVSNGWTPELYTFFHAEFSRPIADFLFYEDREPLPGVGELIGTDVRLVLEFAGEETEPLLSRVGISPCSMEGARLNLQTEIKDWDFERIRMESRDAWNSVLSAVDISDANSPQKEMFYTSLYLSLIYPMLYSDVDGKFRGSDKEVHQGDFRYFGGVLGLWDTFRAQNPLLTILHPDVTNDLMKTFLEHFRHFGQLPQWVTAGQENHGMIGYHAMPVIADAWYKGIRDYDVDALYEAMKTSANVDTFGFFVRGYRGSMFYKEYQYIPCDLEIHSVSKTLEYCYDDWCIAQMARMLGKEEDYDYYIERAAYYRNLYDSGTRLMRPRRADGTLHSPFDPVLNVHYHPGDHYCEGTAYQWTFFVPHDAAGLMDLYGGKEVFISQMDSLFIRSSEIHAEGTDVSDISGMVGQYAHGNEPSHHTIYMYNHLGQPWKTQKWVNHMLLNMYSPTPDGLCGNDDTGQMSAWYVLSAMGFYPVTHGTGIYHIGAPLFEDLKLEHPGGTLSIKARNLSGENIYIQSLQLNGIAYDKNWLQHEDLFTGDVELVFEMGSEPNKQWGSSEDALPPSMSDLIEN